MTNIAPCLTNVIRPMWLMTTQTDRPTTPYPVFFTATKCTLDSILPSSSLRILPAAPDFKQAVTSTAINRLPIGNNDTTNLLGNTLAFLQGWYIPPNYHVTFFARDPTQNALENCGPIFHLTGNMLVADAVTSNFYCTDQKTPWLQRDIGRATYIHTTPYFLIWQTQSWLNVLTGLCSNQQTMYLASPEFPLNTTWKPLGRACDLLVSYVCSEANQMANNTLCRCFKQQLALDKRYKTKVVPVCCFGGLVADTTNQETSCGLTNGAYKTNAMQSKCCTTSSCQQFINSNAQLWSGSVTCNADTFTVVSTSVSNRTASDLVKSYTIPSFSWILVAVAGSLVVLYLVWVVWQSLQASVHQIHLPRYPTVGWPRYY